MNVGNIVTQTTFILGKAFGYLDWSWLWVFAPTCIVIGLVVACFALAYCYDIRTKHHF